MISYIMGILAFLALYHIIKKRYDIKYDILYHTWYHRISWFFLKISCLSCAIFMTDIMEISYDIAFDIRITIYQAWLCIWYDPLISVLLYTKARFDDISAYIMAPARQDGAGWGRQVPDPPPPSASPSPMYWGRWLPWSRAWTCCSGCCASSALRPICSHWKKSACSGHRLWLYSQVRIQLEIASLITMVLNSFIDCLYALTVCALLRWSWLKICMGRVIAAYGHPSRPNRSSPWIRVATPPM